MGKITDAIKALKGAAATPAELEAELTTLRESLAARRAKAQHLGVEWLNAESQPSAEAIAANRAELLRTIERDTARLPQLEKQLIAIKAERQAGLLQQHQREARRQYEKLKAAVLAASHAQAEAMQAREQAVAALGEGAAAQFIPTVAFRGLLLPDLVALWVAEQDRVFAAPTPKPQPVVATRPATTAANGHAPANGYSAPAARPRRQPRKAAAPEPGETTVLVLRDGVEIAGDHLVTGDTVNAPAEAATALVLRGAADFVAEAVAAGGATHV